ncbi:MAG: hypothetical protein L6R41_001893 [Letrouitia leprolyta]|nr:MAG: hypothetical protein L6R41_001893 [Letrouitia leprolyta]
MAGLIHWILPCFAIEGAQGPAEGIQRETVKLSEAGAVERSCKPNMVPYQPPVVGSMHYPDQTIAPKAEGNRVVAENPQQGAAGTKNPESASETQAIKQHQTPTPLSQARARLGRPELTVRIPTSSSKPPVLKSWPSPDDSLNNQQALAAAALVNKPQPSLTETPAYTRWARAQANQTLVQQATKANLRDELECLSIASQEEGLSAYDDKPSAISAKPVSALRSSEIKNSSTHDFAYEEHRDMATRLTPNTLQLARRIVGHEDASLEESKDELNAGRKLC